MAAYATFSVCMNHLQLGEVWSALKSWAQEKVLTPVDGMSRGRKIRTTRIAGGLLWPCKGLLPAAPKDAGFHAVQAQCPCRLGYPLKGS